MALESIAALGLACNVLQVIRYGGEVVEIVTQIHTLGSSARISELDIHASHVRSATRALQNSLNDFSPKDVDQNTTDLHDISQKCLSEADELQRCISSIPRAGRKRDIFSTALWILRRRGHVEKVKHRLDMYQHDLNTRILVNLSLKINASSSQIHYNSFKDEWNELVRELSAEQRKTLETTVHLDGKLTRQAITMASDDIVTQMSHDFSKLDQNKNPSRDHYRCEQLLSSLEYAHMNARRNQIPPPQTTTFDWLFRSLHPGHNDLEDDEQVSWDPFDVWLETSREIYWINGKAGSGKSTLMKHIVCSPHTTSSLMHWAKSSKFILVSHYFWSSGTVLERSFKGCLLAILHQMLLELPDALHHLLTSDTSFTRKKTHDDWAETELITTIEKVQIISHAKVCLFVDGLDESEEPSSNSHTTLLDFLRTQATTLGVKCCVSSRPLVRYENMFANCPQMRLQDLTERDIKIVIDDTFRHLVPTCATDVDIAQLREMQSEVLQKANGVFLWVSLVLKSLMRGFQNGDNISTLHYRLTSLPSELEKLYERMWKQLNDDEKVYREEAAFIFKLVLHREDFWMINTDEHNSYCRSLCFFTMVINGVDIRTALPEHREAAVELIERQCIAMTQLIRTRCAGILEIIGPEETKEPSLANGNLFHDRLKRFVTQEVRFIHRSAYAFLVETAFGRSLVDYCPHSRVDIVIRIVQCALLFWHTKVTNQGELPYTLHLAERIMVQHARTKEERQGLSNAICASLEMYNTLSGWSTGEQDGSYLLYQYVDPAVRYHTIDTAGWMLSFATKQIFAQAYNQSEVVNPEFTDYLLLCLASQIHFKVENPRFHEQKEHLDYLLDRGPRLDTAYFLRYPYPFKKSAALLLTENLIYDLLDTDHRTEPYDLMTLFFRRAADIRWDLSAKFVVLWSIEEMYQSILLPIERVFTTKTDYNACAVLEVNLCYLLDLILMVCSENTARAALNKSVRDLLDTSTNVVPEMQVMLVCSSGGKRPEGLRDESQCLEDIAKRGWRSPTEYDAKQMKVMYEQYQSSRSEIVPRDPISQQPALPDNRSLPSAFEECAQRGDTQHFFRFLETKGYCKRPEDPDVMHKAPKPFIDPRDGVSSALATKQNGLANASVFTSR